MTPWKILWLSGAGLIPMLMSALLAWAAPQPGAMDDIQICYGRFEDSTIAACTRAIGSSKFNGREIAKLYNNRGFEYYVKRDHDRAIADHNKAIEIDPKYAESYGFRGFAYRAKGDDERAMADFSKAIEIDPKFSTAHHSRGMLYHIRGNYDRAIAGYSKAIEIDPKYADAYLFRGRANLYAGSLPKALSDFNKSSELDGKYAYTALWLDIAGKRSNVRSRLLQASGQIDMTRWPAPLIRLFLGQLSPAAILLDAQDPNPRARNRQVCDINFYTGQLALQRDAKQQAIVLFQRAAEDCPKDFFEWVEARAELKVLGVER